MYESPHRQLTARELVRARHLGERLEPQAFESVLQYGLYAQVRLAGIADEVMSRLDTSADERSEFVHLLQRLRRLDPVRRRPNALRQWLPTLRRGSKTEDALLDRYDRMCHRLDRMLPEVEAAGRRVGETLTRFDVLFDRNQTYLEELDLLVYGARMRLESLGHEIEAQRRDDGTALVPRHADRLYQLEQQVERVEQRIVDLEASADTARETGPTIRRIQDDLRSLLLEAQYTSLNTATRWKHRFADAVTRARRNDRGQQSNPAEAPAEIAARQTLAAAAGPVAVLAHSGPDDAASADHPGLAARLRTLSSTVRRVGRMDVADLWWG